MLKLLLYGLVIYFGVKLFRFVSGIQIKSSNKPGGNEQGVDKAPFSQSDIQDAEFKDIED